MRNVRISPLSNYLLKSSSVYSKTKHVPLVPSLRRIVHFGQPLITIGLIWRSISLLVYLAHDGLWYKVMRAVARETLKMASRQPAGEGNLTRRLTFRAKYIMCESAMTGKYKIFLHINAITSWNHWERTIPAAPALQMLQKCCKNNYITIQTLTAHPSAKLKLIWDSSHGETGHDKRASLVESDTSLGFSFNNIFPHMGWNDQLLTHTSHHQHFHTCMHEIFTDTCVSTCRHFIL